MGLISVMVDLISPVPNAAAVTTQAAAASVRAMLRAMVDAFLLTTPTEAADKLKQQTERYARPSEKDPALEAVKNKF